MCGITVFTASAAEASLLIKSILLLAMELCSGGMLEWGHSHFRDGVVEVVAITVNP